MVYNLMYNLTIYNGQSYVQFDNLQCTIYWSLLEFESVGDGATLRMVTL